LPLLQPSPESQDGDCRALFQSRRSQMEQVVEQAKEILQMCEASAYLLKNGQEELVLSEVDVIEPEGDGLRLVSIFGEQKVIRADIHSLNLVNHKIFLKEK
jgi:predicted RNA-binding protein